LRSNCVSYQLQTGAKGPCAEPVTPRNTLLRVKCAGSTWPSAQPSSHWEVSLLSRLSLWSTLGTWYELITEPPATPFDNSVLHHVRRLLFSRTTLYLQSFPAASVLVLPMLRAPMRQSSRPSGMIINLRPQSRFGPMPELEYRTCRASVLRRRIPPIPTIRCQRSASVARCQPRRTLFAPRSSQVP
jgi:hypothetical protein